MHDPRLVSKADFPGTQDHRALGQFLVNYAVLAPSSHNTQPWRFEVGDKYIDLYADLTRALKIADPDHRELVISCGAALGQLQVAANHFGLAAVAERFPTNEDNCFLARISLYDDFKATSEDTGLFTAIKDRRTTRLPFKDVPLPTTLADRLIDEASESDIEIKLITDHETRHEIAELVAAADKIQFSNDAFRKELSSWIRSVHNKHHDGLSSNAQGKPDAMSSINAMIVRRFDVGEGVAAKDKHIAEMSPTLLVIASASDQRDDWLRTGEFLIRLLLHATAGKVTAGYLNQVLELSDFRKKLRELTNVSGFPQLLLRLGVGPVVAPSARRPLDEVLDYPMPVQSNKNCPS